MVLNTIFYVVFYPLFGLDTNVNIKSVIMTIVTKNNQVLVGHFTSCNTLQPSVSNPYVYYTNKMVDNQIKDELIEYIDLLYRLLDVDLTFEKLKKLTEAEKQQIVRDIKLKNLTDKS